MTQVIKPNFLGKDMNNLPINDVKKIQLNQDAAASDEATRLSQVLSEAAAAVQAALVSTGGQASATTAFTSASLVSMLAAKQDNLSIHADSTAYAELVGTQLKFKQLLISKPYVDSSSATLADYLVANPSNDLAEGDVLILTQATTNQQRTWMHNGGTAGDATDFTQLVTDYNEASIRAMFSQGSFISYDVASGVIAVDTGNAVGKLGAHSLPVDTNEFTTITAATTLAALKALEALIVQVDTNATGGTNTLSLRLDNLSGVSGSNLGSFAGLFSNSTSIKVVLNESEAAHVAATSDRALIRTQFAAADSSLDSKINTEIAARIAAVTAEQNARVAADSALGLRIDSADAAIIAETTRASNAENALGARLDTVEGDDATVGSIAKAEKDAKDFATSAVAGEASLRTAADANLQSQIDALQGSAIYRGYIDASGVIVHKDTSDANHGRAFEDVALAEGDIYRVQSGSTVVTITFGDSSTIEVTTGDSVLGLADAATTNAVATNFHKLDNTESEDLLREGQLDSTHLERVGGVIRVKADSLTRAFLAQAVKDDLDDKVSLTTANAHTSFKNTHAVTDATTGAVGGTQIIYRSLDSTNTGAGLGTRRMYLDIHKFYSNGSGNPLAPDQAVVRTQEMEQHGNPQDFSVNIVTDNAEMNHHVSTAKTNSAARTSITTGAHAGISTGHTASASGSTLQNIGNLAHAEDAGVASDVGQHSVLSQGDLTAFAAYLAVNPVAIGGLPVAAAHVADARHATAGYAHVSLGRPSYFDPAQPLTIPSSSVAGSTDASPVSLADVKAKEDDGTFDIGAGSEASPTTVTYTHNLNSKKVVVDLWLNDERVTDAFGIKKTLNGLEITNTSAVAMTGVEVIVMKLS